MQAIQTAFAYKKPPPQLLKWIGNKQRYAPTIVEFMPSKFNKYVEPFVGTGAVLGTVAPHRGLAGDALGPLIGIWRLLQDRPETLVEYYSQKVQEYNTDPDAVYEDVKKSFNCNPNALDLLFLSRTCYGGVVRFTKEGTMSTPRGPHSPISGKKFKRRVYKWRQRIKHTVFTHADFRETMRRVEAGDVVYCDPPYVHTQSILYGAQDFSLEDLWLEIERCVHREAKVLLSIDGKKKSGKQLDVGIPEDLFEREVWIDVGPSMLRRFQKEGERMEGEDVHDRLLLTW